jgi:signal transduction histidine kinase
VVANAWLEIKLREKETARAMLLQSLVTAQEDERANLARELHDQAGQSLTSLLIRLKAMENLCQDDQLEENLHKMQDVVAETINRIRDLSYQLRPPSLEEFGFGTAIHALAEEMTSQSDIKVKIKEKLEQETPHDLALVLYRIVQEGLTNILRHAEAEQVKIDLHQDGNLVYLSIEDDGKGFDPTEIHPKEGKRHLGLISMHERAELIGGMMEMYSAPGEGTMIKVQVPLPGLGEPDNA